MKTVSVLLCVIMVVLSIPFTAPVTAKAEGANLKTTLTDYAGQGGLSYTSTRLMSFDNGFGISRSSMSAYPTYDQTDKKQGAAAMSVTSSSDNSSFVALMTTVGAFNINITNTYAQNLKMWVYVNDPDLIACDHDSVHETPQEDSFTLLITLAYNTSSSFYRVQHTMHGAGWQEIDINFATDNVSENIRQDINWNLRYMNITCDALSGAQLKFDDLRLITYSTTAAKPAAPNNGRWISTCDFDQLDGGIISEWYGSSFDTEDKTQGSSSLRQEGYKIHEDYRITLSGMTTKAYYETDVLCFDFYIDDILKLSPSTSFRVGQSEAGTEHAYYSFDFSLFNAFANDMTGMVSGWNSIKIPLKATKLNVDTTFFGEGYTDLIIRKITIHNPGNEYTTVDNPYVLKIDNIYLTDKSNIDGIIFEENKIKDIYLHSGDEVFALANKDTYAVGTSSHKVVSHVAGIYTYEKRFAQPISLTQGDIIDLFAYVDGIPYLKGIFVEFSSSGTYNKNCARYNVSAGGLLDGKWKKLSFVCPGPTLPTTVPISENGYTCVLASSQTDDMYPDWENINYMRIGVSTTGACEVSFNGLNFNKSRDMFTYAGETLIGNAIENTEDYKVGEASYGNELTYETSVSATKVFADPMALEEGDTFGLWFYTSDASRTNDLCFDFSSSGKDVNVARFTYSSIDPLSILQKTIVDGWNYLEFVVPAKNELTTGVTVYNNGYKLLLRDTSEDAAALDWSNITYMRLFSVGKNTATAEDPVYVAFNGLTLLKKENFLNDSENVTVTGATGEWSTEQTATENSASYIATSTASGNIVITKQFIRPESMQYGEYIGTWVYIDNVSNLSRLHLQFNTIKGFNGNSVKYSYGTSDVNAVGNTFKDGWNYIKLFVPSVANDVV